MQERARKAALHPTLDWWFAVLVALQGLEEALLAPPAGPGTEEAPVWSEAAATKASVSCVAQPAGAERTVLLLPQVPTLTLPPPPFPVVQLGTLQQWRWALLRVLHEDPQSSQAAALAQHYEPLLFRWMRLRKAAAGLLAAAGRSAANDSTWAAAAQRWAAAAEQLDTAAGMAAGAAPPKPLLWKAGGRPLLPRTLVLSEAYGQLLALCDATR